MVIYIFPLTLGNYSVLVGWEMNQEQIVVKPAHDSAALSSPN